MCIHSSAKWAEIPTKYLIKKLCWVSQHEYVCMKLKESIACVPPRSRIVRTSGIRELCAHCCWSSSEQCCLAGCWVSAQDTVVTASRSLEQEVSSGRRCCISQTGEPKLGERTDSLGIVEAKRKGELTPLSSLLAMATGHSSLPWMTLWPVLEACGVLSLWLVWPWRDLKLGFFQRTWCCVMSTQESDLPWRIAKRRAILSVASSSNFL